MDKSEHTLMMLNLIENCKFFEPFAVKTEGSGCMLNEHNSHKQDQIS